MRIEVVFYRTNDADLLTLMSYGYELPVLARMALSAYARGERIKYHLDVSMPAGDLLTLPYTRYRYQLQIKDPAVIGMLTNVRRGWRNRFIKALIRDMFDASLVGAFLLDPGMETARLGTALIQGDTAELKAAALQARSEGKDTIVKTETAKRTIVTATDKTPKAKDTDKTKSIVQLSDRNELLAGFSAMLG